MRTAQSTSGPEPVSTPDIRRAVTRFPISTFLSTGLGIGFFPWVPGTVGSALALVLAWGVLKPAFSISSSLTGALGLLMSGLAVGAAGIPLSTRAARAMGVKDPRCIVIDEIAGQWIALAAVPLFHCRFPAAEAVLWATSFVCFRAFDIWKPGPVRRLQELPEGWGIVADDLLAGALACGSTAALGWVLCLRA